MIFENPDGSLQIYDWKRCKEIKKVNSFNKYSTNEIISHLPDTNYWHYSLHEYNYKGAIIKTDEGLCSIYDDANSYATILYKFIVLQNYFTPKYLNFNLIPYRF